ncbi:MAG: type II secretion system protein [Eubacteriales bacterium]|nr:type II secretion system protein [Eubacteriales bacterium]
MRNQKGFTMAELLVTIGILSVLLALGGLSVLQYAKTKAITEADAAAKSIYLAAQNQLTAKVSSGEWEELKLKKNEETEYFGTEIMDVEKPSDFPKNKAWDQGDYCYLIYNKGDEANADSNPFKTTALGEMLPFGSVDEDLRKGGSYVIEYNKKTGTVYGVFYTLEEKTTEPKKLGYGTDILPLNKGEVKGRTSKEVRKDPKNKTENPNALIIGYYGGSAANSLPTGDLKAPKITVENGEKLIVKITDENEDTNLLLTITGGTSKAKAEIARNKDGFSNNISLTYVQKDGEGNPIEKTIPKTIPEGAVSSQGDSKVEYQLTLDDVTRSGGHFADMFSQDVSGEGIQGFIPGEDLIISAKISATTQLAAPVVAEQYTNSLYEAVVPVMKTQSEGEAPKQVGLEAVVTCARHLQNLSADVSNVPTEGENAVKKVSQTKDVDWKNLVDSAYTRESKFGIGVGGAAINQVLSENAFCAITNQSIEEYEGNGKTLSNFTIAKKDGSAAGLFAKLEKTEVSEGTEKKIPQDLVVSNVNIKGINVTAENNAAGAILGEALSGSSLTVKNVTIAAQAGQDNSKRNRISTKKEGKSTTGSAGGVLGRLEGGVFTGQNVTIADTDVETDSNSAGGVVGRLEDGGFSGTDIMVNDTTVQVAGTGSAGGVVGKMNGNGEFTGEKVTVMKVDVATKNNSAGGVVGRLEGGDALPEEQLKGSNIAVMDVTVTTKNNSAGGILGTAVKAGKITVTSTTIVSPKIRTQNGYGGGVFGKIKDSIIDGTDIAVLNPTVTVSNRGSAGGVAGLLALEKGTLKECAVYMEGDEILNEVKRPYEEEIAGKLSAITSTESTKEKTAGAYYKEAALIIKENEGNNSNLAQRLGDVSLDEQIHIFAGGQEENTESAGGGTGNTESAGGETGSGTTEQTVPTAGGQALSLRTVGTYNALQKLSERIDLQKMIQSMAAGTVRNDNLTLLYAGGNVLGLRSSDNGVATPQSVADDTRAAGADTSAALLALNGEALGLKGTDQIARNVVVLTKETASLENEKGQTDEGKQEKKEAEETEELAGALPVVEKIDDSNTTKEILPVAGGLVGVICNGDKKNDESGVTIAHSFASVPTAVDKEGEAGGLIGHISRKDENVKGVATKISHCYTGGYTEGGEYSKTEEDATSSYYGVASVAGTLSDKAEDGNKTAPEISEEFKSNSSVAGGLIGVDSKDTTVEYSYSTAAVYGDTAGGLIGKQPDGSYEECYAAGKVGPENVFSGQTNGNTQEDTPINNTTSEIKRGAFFGAKGLKPVQGAAIKNCYFLAQSEEDQQLEVESSEALTSLSYGELESKTNYAGIEENKVLTEEKTYCYGQDNNNSYPFPLTTTTGYPKKGSSDAEGKIAVHYGDWEAEKTSNEVLPGETIGLVYYEKIKDSTNKDSTNATRVYYNGYTCQRTEEGRWQFVSVSNQSKKTGNTNEVEAPANGLVTGKGSYVVEDGYLLLLPKEKSVAHAWILSGTKKEPLQNCIAETNDGVITGAFGDEYKIYYLTWETEDGSQLETLKIQTTGVSTFRSYQDVAVFNVNTKFADTVSSPPEENQGSMTGMLKTQEGSDCLSWKIRSVRHLVNMGKLADADGNLPDNYSFVQQMDIDFGENYTFHGTKSEGSGGSYCDRYQSATLRSGYSGCEETTQSTIEETTKSTYAIKNLNKPLFSNIAEGGTLFGLCLENNSSISGSAIVSGENKGQIRKCTVSCRADSDSEGKFKINLPGGTSGLAIGGMVGTNSGTISNCSMISGEVIYDGSGNSSGGIIVAGLAGTNTGVIQKCTLTDVTVTGAGVSVAGLVGKNINGAKIETCSVSGAKSKLQGDGNVSGLVDSNSGMITGNSEVNSSSITSNSRSGSAVGIVRENSGEVSKCHVDGTTITGAMYAVGMTDTNSGNLEDCTVKGSSITSNSEDGSAIGIVRVNAGNVLRCEVIGTTIGGEGYVIGIADTNEETGTIKQCKIEGDSSAYNDHSGDRICWGVKENKNTTVDSISERYVNKILIGKDSGQSSSETNTEESSQTGRETGEGTSGNTNIAVTTEGSSETSEETTDKPSTEESVPEEKAGVGSADTENTNMRTTDAENTKETPPEEMTTASDEVKSTVSE